MRLYNTLTRKVEDIQPLNPPTLSVYTCGPTVYDYPHIGNWFTFIRYDLLVRTLKSQGLQPKWVMNITDVGHLVSDADEGQDKLEKGAAREGKTAWDIASFYSDYFINGLGRLNFNKPDFLPRATQHIQEQIDLIKILEEKGYTYVIDDGVYYDTSKFPKYADFAQLDLDEQQTGKRVEFNPQKHNPTDFALWKFSPTDRQRDMEWESPWGKGFPGWHIECSAMCIKYLGETVDIHAGGIDHLPVHHTNEVAQSEAATGKSFAKYWMHTNHILVDDEKISKSLANGISLEDIEKKGYNLQALRLLVLQSHYRSQSKFSWEELEAANNRLNNYQAFADLRLQAVDPNVHGISRFDYDQQLHEIQQALNDDLSTPKALASLDLLVDKRSNPIVKTELPKFMKFIETVDSMLGLQLAVSEDITNDQKDLIAKREAARQAQDWLAADELRAQLKQQGIEVNDTSFGPIWYRI